MRHTDILKICDQSNTVRILCVGDLMLDRFVYGKVDRISPEAPIPVLKQHRTISMLGAAGNVARNVSSLGARACLIGLVGEDTSAEELKDQIDKEYGIDGICVADSGRQTTVKVRYIANSQQLLRVDHEDVHGAPKEAEDELNRQIVIASADAHAILLSDYAKGCVTPSVIRACLEIAKVQGIPLIVDPKGSDFSRYGEVDLIKPNARELSDATGLPTGTDQEIEFALTKLLDHISAKAALVTRSEKGLSFLRRGEAVVHVPTISREVYDVSGAGDTSLAALGISLATGAGLEMASEFALSAAGIAVGKIGTAAVSLKEVRADIMSRNFLRTNLASGDDAATFEKIEDWRRQGLKIGFTNGCFDILHAGHLSALEFAASYCDRLIVGLNDDASVSRLKGPSRPVNAAADRQALLYGLKPVDAVILFSEDTPYELIKKLQPDVIVKGGDYTPDSVVGADIVKAKGGQVIIAPLLEGRSTTGIISRAKS